MQSTVESDQGELLALARAHAKVAHEQDFDAQWGVAATVRPNWVVFFSNRGEKHWQREAPQLRRQLQADGYEELETASYPEDAYSHVLIAALPEGETLESAGALYRRAFSSAWR